MSTTEIPKKQQAWIVVRRGEPKDAVKFTDQREVPSKIPKGHALIKVEAAAMNPVGYKLMSLVPNFAVKRPHVAEYDFTGIVVDANDTAFQNGQAVYGMVNPSDTMKTGYGALSQYTVCAADRMTTRPAHLKPTEAAGLAIVGFTAYQALFTMANLEAGQSIFINGGSTTVGIAAIQMAKSLGCKVTATGSSRREELFKSLGVDTFIDYTQGPIHKQLEANPPSTKFHLFLEAVGNTDVKMYTHSEKYLAPGGHFISVGPFPHGVGGFFEMLHLCVELVRPAFLGGVRRKWSFVRELPSENVPKYGELVNKGVIKPVIDSVYEFEEVPQAYERSLSQRAAGKIVVKVDPNVE
ncbi:NAD-P-binding protein [Trametopsis cervina]|nr:NAD-P-binding protein [Trametopsis cervina]